MTAGFFLLLAIAAGLCFWWMRQRSARLRREAEDREAQVLETLFAARRSAADNGGETLDLDKVFGGKAAAGSNPTRTDDVLRAAGLGAELIALVKSPPKTASATLVAAASEGTAAAGGDDAERSSSPARAARAHEDDSLSPGASRMPPAGDDPVPVRDLVQVFYEARGYGVLPAARVARPVEVVLRHKTDPLRSYAFVPLAEPVSEATARVMLERARRIDQARVLIATERAMAPGLSSSLRGQGIRVLDSAAIEAQLAKLDFATAARIRAVAHQRSVQRARSAAG